MEACGLASHAPELFRGGGRRITGVGVAHRRADGCLHPSLVLFDALSGRQKAAFIAALDGFCGAMQGAVRAACWRGITCACVRLREPHPSCGSAAVKFLLGMRSEGGGTAAAHGGSALHTLRAVARGGCSGLFPEYPPARLITRRAGRFLCAPLYRYTWLQA